MLHFDGMHTNGVSIFRLWVLSDVWCCIWKVCFTAYQKVMPYTRRHVNVYAVREKAIELAENKQIFRLVIDDSTPYNKHGFINKLFNSDFFFMCFGIFTWAPICHVLGNNSISFIHSLSMSYFPFIFNALSFRMFTCFPVAYQKSNHSVQITEPRKIRLLISVSKR